MKKFYIEKKVWSVFMNEMERLGVKCNKQQVLAILASNDFPEIRECTRYYAIRTAVQIKLDAEGHAA